MAVKDAIFPKSWGWFFDEVLPAYVKNQYSPKESWKERPFSREDAVFFLKGVRELSDKFTDGRDDFRAGYFSHPKFRSSYLLYFLPLQAAKFLLLMDQHKDHVRRIVEEGKKKGKLRIADIGAGPGTASIAVLLYLLGNHPNDIPAEIEFVWCDEAEKMMEDGMRLVLELCRNFRPLEGKVTVKFHVGDWKRHRFVDGEAYDWTLFGHVLNEGKSFHQIDRVSETLREWVERSGTGGVLFIEPAFRASSQLLGKIRDQLILKKEAPVLDPDEDFLEDGSHDHDRASIKKTPDLPVTVVGPCIHDGKCPMASGKDWCHFSAFAQTPGKWFEFFSKGLSSQKEWIKYSYLWVRAHPAGIAVRKREIDPLLRLVLTDSLTKSPNAPQMYLLCEPGRPRRMTIPRTERVRRGDFVQISAKAAAMESLARDSDDDDDFDDGDFSDD